MKVIGIDFDKTLYPINDIIVQEMQDLMEIPNHFIVIYTARRKSQRKFIEEILDDACIPYHAIVLEKMRADVYIDDRNLGGLKWPIKK